MLRRWANVANQVGTRNLNRAGAAAAAAAAGQGDTQLGLEAVWHLADCFLVHFKCVIFTDFLLYRFTEGRSIKCPKLIFLQTITAYSVMNLLFDVKCEKGVFQCAVVLACTWCPCFL
jgi:hypothetical protein